MLINKKILYSILIILLIIILLKKGKKEEKFKIIGYNKNFCKNQIYNNWKKKKPELLEELKICDSNKNNCHIF